jgi:hypothetical protein
MRALNIIAWISVGAGVVTAILALIIAVEHNPQGALINQGTGAVDFRYALILFFSWFLMGGVITGVATSAVWWVTTLMKGAVTK